MVFAAVFEVCKGLFFIKAIRFFAEIKKRGTKPLKRNIRLTEKSATEKSVL